MKIIIHKLSAFAAILCITSFFLATIISEIFGSYSNIIIVKNLILFPGLFILIPIIITTGISGFIMTKSKKGIIAKKKEKNAFYRIQWNIYTYSFCYNPKLSSI